MNLGFNNFNASTGSYMNPMMAMMPNSMMYGGNFVDILFRHLMEQGWEGFTLMAVFNFYVYLSLDKIKDLFKYINDIIATQGKDKLEYLSKNGYSIVKDNGYKGMNLLLAYYKNRKHYGNTTNISDTMPELAPKNSVTVALDTNNKTDLMSLGSFLLKCKNTLDITSYSRSKSDRYKTTEIYIIPNSFVISKDVIDKYNADMGFTIPLDITVKLFQNVDYKLVCESDNNLDSAENIKDVKFTSESDKKTYTNFVSFAKSLKPPISTSSLPPFKFGGWKSDPYHMCGGYLTGILFYIYYTCDKIMFQKLHEALSNPEKSFDFDGVSHHIIGSEGNFLSIKEKATMDSFLKEFEEYNNDKLIPHIAPFKPTIDKWISDNKHLFEAVLRTQNVINLSFESNTVTNDDLLVYSRKFINKLILDYYNQTVESIGNKISIYQLYIKYEVEKKKKDNPEHAIWKKKYGKYKKINNNSDKSEDKPKSDEKTTSDSSKTASTTTGGSSSTAAATADTDKSKTESKDDPKNESAGDKGKSWHKLSEYAYVDDDVMGDDFDFYPAPSGRRRGGGNPYYGNRFQHMFEPPKFIEEEVNIPLVESEHIKSDKKPFKYLYLQKHYKDTLESYLLNFKNNRDLYEKFGITYKGGIILSGFPGCGKSSTILAIATYLNKDIYYLDLGRLKTNNELKLCIDHVKTTSQKGGIIIFEDIDCMTDIVKSRTLHNNMAPVTAVAPAAGAASGITVTNSDITINEVSEPSDKTLVPMKTGISIDDGADISNAISEKPPNFNSDKNDALSLSFLLNMLDGTMAPENIIFIMTTNHKELLDPALIRPGRMDISINIDKCNRHQLQQIYYDLYNKQLNEDIVTRFREYEFMTAEVIMALFHNIYNKGITEEELLHKFLTNHD